MRKGAIGIDIGATNTRAATWQNGRIDIIYDEVSGDHIPSIVAFTKDKTIVGEAANEYPGK